MMTALCAIVLSAGQWQTTKATFYGDPYDDGKRRVCFDGRTVYTTNGMFCATGLAPIGSMIEVRRGSRALRLLVADKQAPRFRHMIDIPTGTWAKLGAPHKAGKIAVEWRKL